jgi:hypothetical protein
MREQAKLQFTRQGQDRAPSAAPGGQSARTARVFDGDGKLCRERGQGALVILGEIVAAGVLEIEHPDYFSW